MKYLLAAIALLIISGAVYWFVHDNASYKLRPPSSDHLYISFQGNITSNETTYKKEISGSSVRFQGLIHGVPHSGSYTFSFNKIDLFDKENYLIISFEEVLLSRFFILLDK